VFFSLGYADALLEAAESGAADTRSSISVDRSSLRRAVTATFPDADAVSVAAEPLAGDGGLSYVVTTTAPDRTAVLKLVPSNELSTLRTGVRAYDHVSSVPDVPVPTVYALDTSEQRLSYPYSVVDHVGGDELDEVSQFRSFARERKRSLVRAMGRTLGALHERTAFDRYGSLSADGEALTVDGVERDWASFYADRYRQHAADAADSPVADLATEAADCFERVAADLDGPAAPALLHGDFTPDNLVIRDGDVRAVLDWEHAKAGDPAWEAWKLTENVVRLFDGEAREDLRAALTEGYRDAASPSAAFQARKAAFAVGEFTRVAGVRRVLTNTVEAFDAAAFRRRAEAELSARCERAESRLR
jgi:aminoglycoside phosphotransferase (APT) family kinase protein